MPAQASGPAQPPSRRKTARPAFGRETAATAERRTAPAIAYPPPILAAAADSRRHRTARRWFAARPALAAAPSQRRARGSRLRLRHSALDEAGEQLAHRLDRLDSSEREIAEDETRIAERGKAVRLGLVRGDPRSHPAPPDFVAKVRGFHPGARGDRPQHLEVADVSALLEGDAKDCVMVRRERARLARELRALERLVRIEPSRGRLDRNAGFGGDVADRFQLEWPERQSGARAIVAQRDRHAFP